jgi:uncharacterized protein YyaL (SSP411 family)
MNKYIYFFLFLTFSTCSCVETNRTSKSNKNNNSNNFKHTNQLINESSPYLLQHAHNPVNWYPWGEKALKKAKAENKMLIISVGYSACHWCHVMEKESFEDSLVAKVMNDNFISIKVDREERPDIDDIYMTSCHLSSGGNCGWPLNAMALPNGQPFWAGTYFPKDKWLKVMQHFIDLRKNDPKQIEKFAANITEGIKSAEVVEPAKEEVVFDSEKLKPIFKYFDKAIDYNKGGRHGNIKFPMPTNWMYLLEYYSFSKDKKALDGVMTTLEKMAYGGIYDHIGGGFARYSTDADWKVPHFEKMLYDNGQLVSLYSKAFQLTKKPLYKNVVYETLDFIERELTDENGGFYSSLNADSEGEEGKYYVWTYDELSEAINNDAQTELFSYFYNITKTGNWEDGKNIIHINRSYGDVAKKYNTTSKRVKTEITLAKAKLLVARQSRIAPSLDDKILTAWNAIMLKGYVDAYRVFGEQRFLDAAIKNATFLMENATKNGHRLNRNYKGGKSVINAFLDDYGLMSEAFTALYQATFEEKWIIEAKAYTDYALKHFYDDESGVFNYTSDIDPPLIARKKEISDNVIPSSNSVMAKNLYILGSYFFEDQYLKKSDLMMKNVSKQVLESQQPYFFSNWLSLYLMLSKPPYEVAIVGKDCERLRKEIETYYLPNAILLGGAEEGDLILLDGKLVKGETIIYVCQDKICKSPVETVKEALKWIE